MGWNLNDLTSSADAPAASSDPTGFVFPSRSTQHVFYRGTDNHVHELKWDRTGWKRFDLTSGKNAPPAAGNIVALVCMRAATQHVFYVGTDSHVHELVNSGTGWTHTDITVASKSQAKAVGNPSACVLEQRATRHVVFRDAEGRVHELTAEGPAWKHADVTALAQGAVPAAGQISAQAQESTGARFFVYRGADGHVHELACDAKGWRASDLTAIVQGAPPASGDPCSYVFEGHATRHVDYRCAKGHIHELRLEGGSWAHTDLTQKTGAPAADTDPSAYMFNLQGTQHVLFRAADQNVHELWWDVNGWHHDAIGAIGPHAAGRIAGYSFEIQRTQHAVYRQADGRVAELWWHPDGTGTGGTGKGETKSIEMKWNPIVFDGGIPMSGSAQLSLHADGRFEFKGTFHGSGFSPYEVNILWGIRTSTGALFTFATQGSVSGTLGAGSRDFQWNFGGTDTDLRAAWNDLQKGYTWQAQSGTSLEFGRLWGDVKGAIGELHSITSVVGPVFS